MIGIVAVLAAILLPVLARARRQANEVVCMNNLRQLGLGAGIYTSESRGWLPWEGFAEGDRPERSVGWWEEPAVWFNCCPKCARQPAYFEVQNAGKTNGNPIPKSGDKGLFVCPDGLDPVAGKDDVVQDGYFMMWGLDAAGNAEQRKTYWCYAYNTQLDGGVEDRHSDHRIMVNLPRIKRSTYTVFLYEKLMRPREYTPAYAGSIMQSEGSYTTFTTRHRKGGMVLFLDFHVQWMSRREVLAAPGAPANYNQPNKIVWDPTTP